MPLGLTVQQLTNGAFKKSMLMYSVATGVAVGIALGISKLVLHLDLATILLPLYGIGIVLTIFSTEEFVNVAWDSAGVTTGPVTVPLVLAMGLGLGNAVSAVEGFGILSMASIRPIIAVLSMGIFIRTEERKNQAILIEFEEAEIVRSPSRIFNGRQAHHLCLTECLREEILEAAKNSGAQGASVSYARGTGIRDRMA